MFTDLLDPPVTVMAPKKRTYAAAKVDVEALALARKAAALQDKTLADYISDVLLRVAPADIQAGAARFGPKPKAK